MKSTISFDDRCYELLNLVPKGRVTTYKEIARALGSRAYRAVGSAMRKNKYAPMVPCHRVVKSNGEIGEYNAGAREKTMLLEREGVEVNNGKVEDFKKKMFKFNKKV